MMINIAICDDQTPQLEIIRKATEQYFSSIGENSFTIKEYDNPSVFLDAIAKEGAFDIVLLDICMPGMSGMDVARTIRKRQDNTEIIFLTTSDEFAVDAFTLKATHYIVKPFTQSKFSLAIARALEHFSNRCPKKIIIYSENGAIQVIDIDSIFYIESIQYKRYVHTKDMIYTETRKSLTALQDELDQLSHGQFIMAYRGYIVNMSAIRTILPNEIILQNSTIIPIKNGDFRKIRDLYFAYSFKKED